MDIRCNPNAAPDWLADLYRAWRKAEEVGAAAAEAFRRDLAYCLGCLTLADFGCSGFAVGFDSPVVGEKVWFVADNYGGELEGPVYTARELAHLLASGAGPDDLGQVRLARSVFPGSELVGEGEFEPAKPGAGGPEGGAVPLVDLSPRDPGLVSRVRVALGRLAAEVADCRACGLSGTRTRTVPGAGDAAARVVVVGEGPGKREDLTGKPFVGRAGRVLDQMLDLAGLSRRDVYVTNVVKCRPVAEDGSDRKPQDGEVAACAGFLKKQLLLLDPALVIACGATAFEWFMPGLVLGGHRGRLVRAEGWLVYPVYHPAAALYRPEMRAAMEDDWRRLGELLRGKGACTGAGS